MASRIVSLVPSLTELVVQLGAGERLVGVTTYCPHDATRVGGSKWFDVERVVDLAPDVVLANVEENEAQRLEALRDAGLHVLATFPRAVRDVPALVRSVAEVVGGDAAPVVVELETTLEEVRGQQPTPPVRALTLIWRRPWMAVGAGTYADDLLATCGFVNVVAGAGDRYPRVDAADLHAVDVVLLPGEPYRFTAEDLPAVTELTAGAPARLVDGAALLWHGPRTAAALRTFTALARDVAAAR